VSEQHTLSISKSYIPIPLTNPPVKVYQTPQDPVNTRYVKRKWENLLYNAAKKIVRFGYISTKYIRDKTGIIAFESHKGNMS